MKQGILLSATTLGSLFEMSQVFKSCHLIMLNIVKVSKIIKLFVMFKIYLTLKMG